MCQKRLCNDNNGDQHISFKYQHLPILVKDCPLPPLLFSRFFCLLCLKSPLRGFACHLLFVSLGFLDLRIRPARCSSLITPPRELLPLLDSFIESVFHRIHKAFGFGFRCLGTSIYDCRTHNIPHDSQWLNATQVSEPWLPEEDILRDCKNAIHEYRNL